MNLKHLSVEELNELLAIKKSDIKAEIQLRKTSSIEINKNYEINDCFIKTGKDGSVYLKKITGIFDDGIMCQYIFIIPSASTIEVYDNEFSEFVDMKSDYKEIHLWQYDEIYCEIESLNENVNNLYTKAINNCLDVVK